MFILALYVHTLKQKPFHNVRCQNTELDTCHNHNKGPQYPLLCTVSAYITLAHCGGCLHMELPCIQVDQVPLMGKDVVVEFV